MPLAMISCQVRHETLSIGTMGIKCPSRLAMVSFCPNPERPCSNETTVMMQCKNVSRTKLNKPPSLLSFHRLSHKLIYPLVLVPPNQGT